MKKLLLATAIFATLSAPTAYACMQMPAENAFIYANDKNKDGKLSKKEWQTAKIDGYFVAFRLGNASDFAKLDTNKNGFLSDTELTEKVRYQREPCADWEEQMHKMTQEQNTEQK